LKRFCRSIELCDNYLRGYYGLKLVGLPILKICGEASLTPNKTVQQLLSEPSLKASKQTESEEWSVPAARTLKNLDEVATEKLAEIVRRNSAGEKGWQGYEKAEIAAARELLKSSSTAAVR
jgi:hypothetical protein